jgi:PE-PPE domain/PE family
VSYVVAMPDSLASAAEDLAAVGSSVSVANAAAANSTTSLLAAAADEVSTSLAAMFGAHGLEYQAVSAQLAQANERFVQNLSTNANAYLTTEIANAAQTLSPASIPGAAAGVRITIPGAGPLYYPNFITTLPYLGQVLLEGGVPGPSSVSILQGYELLNHAIGENWFPGTLAQVDNYPASIGIFSGSLAAPNVNEAIAFGQRALNDQIMNAFVNGNGSPVSIAGLSEGTLVVNRELIYLATDPTAPPPSALQFAMFSSPEVGLFHTYLPNGFTIPVVNYTGEGLPNTQYNLSVVFGQYDFWGNPPDRPWNLLADVNSLFGAAFYHDPVSLMSPSDLVQLSSVTDSAGGTITTYMLPSPTLPMLMPLQYIGVPQPVVNNLNSVLQPIVNAGYSSLDPNAGPWFSGGYLQGLPPNPFG